MHSDSLTLAVGRPVVPLLRFACWKRVTMDFTRNLFLSLVGVLLGFGCLMVYSSSITSWPTEFERVYLSRHLMFLTLGVLAGGCATCLPARFWYHLAPWLFVLTVILLVAVLVPGVGTRVKGAQRWFRFGPIAFQPSELAKVALPLFLARTVYQLEQREKLHRLFAGTWPVLLPMGMIVPLVLIEPDLGTAAFLSMGGAMLLFVGGWPIRNFVLGAMIVIPAGVYGLSLKSYQMDRINGFLAAWTNISEAPYQLKQSLVALGLGGTQGVGLGKGWQKLSFLPEANTDFVFAVVGEELGLVGTLSLVTLWVSLLLTGLWLLHPLRKRSFEYLAGVTLLLQLVLQASINVAVVTAMVPPKGISHPLISAGGSNLVMSLVAFGLIVSLSRGTDVAPQAEPVLT